MILSKPEPLLDRQKRWARESGIAWADHHEKIRARDNNMIRLKALRLAKHKSDLEAAALLPIVEEPKRKSVQSRKKIRENLR